jgi:hypothetical protein
MLFALLESGNWGVNMAFSKARRLANLMSADSDEVPAAKRSLAAGTVETAKLADDAVTSAKIADDAVNEVRMQISNAPTNGYILSAQSGNTGGLTWVEAEGGAYSDWSVKTSAYTALSKDQLIANSGSAFTITLPASPSAGAAIVIHNTGAGTVTIGRNSSNINSTADDGELTTGKSTQLVYVDGTIGWKEI